MRTETNKNDKAEKEDFRHIPTTDEAERSEISERLDELVIKDHLRDDQTSRIEKDDVSADPSK